MTATIDWFEILSANPQTTRTFYKQVFGWEFSDAGPDYAVFQGAGGSLSGGVGEQKGPRGWLTVYLRVDDVDATVATAEKSGAGVLLPPTDIEQGRIAVLSDPDGNPLGLIQRQA